MPGSSRQGGVPARAPCLPEQGPAWPSGAASPVLAPTPCHRATPSSSARGWKPTEMCDHRRVPLFVIAAHTTAWRTARPLSPGPGGLRAQCQEPGPPARPRLPWEEEPGSWEGPAGLRLPTAAAPCSPHRHSQVPGAQLPVPGRTQPGAAAAPLTPGCSWSVPAFAGTAAPGPRAWGTCPGPSGTSSLPPACARSLGGGAQVRQDLAQDPLWARPQHPSSQPCPPSARRPPGNERRRVQGARTLPRSPGKRCT